ncbi:MAG: Holliday junction resolvase RuvX [Actinobacteria bacterium]|nr:Holliday junction resolvase RuvX [Actinomycetota bacterium]MBU1942273.1 Holliday junction resolvase RuvX [Actinomycetota bacterium]MBU2687378.1 Holliday junction resolvase RuvX [Actinomycetota bacterium]
MKESRLIGLDVGERRIGVALSDPLGHTAQPYITIENDEGAIPRIGELVSESGVGRVVVGLPLLLDGREGAQAARAREFASRLGEHLSLPVEMIDERLTTRQATSVISRSEGAGRKDRGATDRVAAALILQSYLDGHGVGTDA